MYTKLLKTLVIGLGCGLPLAASAAEVELSLAHWVPGSHPLQVLGMEPWAESIKKASNGRIEITIYPSQQLGAAADHYDMARDGIADIGFINPGYQPGRFPILAAAELPFNFANAKGGVRALTEWYQQYDDAEMSDTFFCMAITHDPGTMHGKSPILVPADIKGQAVRAANATEGRFVNLLGGATVQVPAPAMRDALEKGTADITMSPWESLYIFGATPLVKHHLDMPFYASINAFVFNKAKVESMAPEDQKVIYDHCSPEWAEKMSSGWADVEAAGRAKVVAEPDHIIYTPNEAETQLWKDAAAPLTNEWLKSMTDAGEDGDAILANLIDTLKKHDSYAGE